MYPEDCIRAFGKRMGLALELDESGACTFSSDGFTVTLMALPELSSVALTADLGEPPPEKLENLYKMMLESNYLFNGTHGATLSLKSETGHCFLCGLFPCNAAEESAFFSAVERFINTSESWAKIIAGYRNRVENFPDAPENENLQLLNFLRV